MNKKVLLFVASALVSSASFAQDWEAPESPQFGKLTLNDTVYLYNVDAKGFFLGANSWETQASIDPKKGWRCLIAPVEGKDGIVTIMDSVECRGINSYKYFWATATEIYTDYNNQDASIEWKFEEIGENLYKLFVNGLDVFNGWPLGINLTSDNQTVLQFNNPDYNEDNLESDQYNRWTIVSKASYDAYQAEYVRYETALALFEKIQENESIVNVTEAYNVYMNTNSTTAELNAAIKLIDDQINKMKEEEVDPENPPVVTDEYIPDADFELNQGAGVWKKDFTAQNFQTNGTPDKMEDPTYFLEAWDGNSYKGKIYLSIPSLPNGIYEFTLSAATNGSEPGYVYANEDSIAVTTGSKMTAYTVFTYVQDNKLEVGFKLPTAKQNWVGIDDAKLRYFGNAAASFANWFNAKAENAKNYDDVKVQQSLLDTYNAILETNTSGMTKEQIIAKVAELDNISDAIEENAAAYATFKDLIDQGNDLLDKGYAGDEAVELEEYIVEEATDIIDGLKLGTEELKAAITKLSDLVQIVKTNCLAKGMDCTNLIANPNFTNKLNGWEYDSQYTEIAWGGKSENPNAERWNANFDCYQTITNVPNGVYTLKVQAFYRPVGSTTTAYQNYTNNPDDEVNDIKTFIYINNSLKPVVNIATQTFTEQFDGAELVSGSKENGDALYVVNTMNSSTDAFNTGAYQNVVKGIVTDGTLRVGIKNTTGTESGRWSLWDNFRLSFEGMDLETIHEMIENYGDEVANLSNQPANAEVLEALKNTYNNGIDETDGNKAFKLLNELINNIDKAKASIEAYKKLSDAKDTFAAIFDETTAAEDVVAAATSVFNEIDSKFSSNAYTDEEIDAVIETIKFHSTKLRLPVDIAEASEENPKEITSVIENNSFEDVATDNDGNTKPTAKGWTFSKGDDTGVKDNSESTYAVENADGSYIFNTWKGAAFDYYVSQKIYGLPEGTYKLSAILASDKGNKITLSGNEQSETFEMENAKEIGVVESILFLVKEGDVVEVKASSTSWFKVDNFTLDYYGKDYVPTAVNEVATDNVPAAIFTVTGARVNNYTKGINIVKMSDGSVKKVLVK